LTRDPAFSVAVGIAEEFSDDVTGESSEDISGVVGIVRSLRNFQRIFGGPEYSLSIEPETARVAYTAGDDLTRVVVGGEGGGEVERDDFGAAVVDIYVRSRSDVYVNGVALEFDCTSVVSTSGGHVHDDLLLIGQGTSAVVLPSVDDDVTRGIDVSVVIATGMIQSGLISDDDALSISVRIFKDGPDVSISRVNG